MCFSFLITHILKLLTNLLGRYARVVDHLAIRDVAQGAPLGGGSTLHPILRTEITQSKWKSFQNFISRINYQKDSQKTHKYIAGIQNNTSCNNKVPIYENNDVITSDRGIANTFARAFSRAQKKGTYARRKSKIIKGEYKTLKQKNGSAKPTATEDIFD